MENNKTLDFTSEKATVGISTGGSSYRLKRAFSMPRNPFQCSRSTATKGNSVASSSATTVSSRLGGSCINNGEAALSQHSGCIENDANSTKNVIRGNDSCKESRLCAPPSDQQDFCNASGNRNSNNKLKKSSSPEEMAGLEDSSGGRRSENKIFRRLSVKKFINRIAQQMNYVNRTVNNHKFDKVQSSQTSTLNGSIVRSSGGGGKFVWPPDTVPGVIGLRNHGNTCFMNAVLQCLSHTDILAQYFVLDLYKADLKRRNKINAKKFGTKGELTEQLALVLKSLWTCKDAPDYSSNFKAVVDRYGSQFRSSTQHDAQEFLFWLLDKVHEDLNTATKRKYKTIKNNGRSDEVIAAETLANYVRCNNSFVQAVFQAQFRSSLSCPTCGKQSNTFDPFYCLSVPLPQLSQQLVLVKVIYSSQQPKQVKLGLGIPHGSPVVALREQLHADTGIALNRMILTEICDTGFNRVFCDSHLMSSVRENDPIYCIECPQEAVAGQQESNATNGTKILLLLCNGKRITTTTNGSVNATGAASVKRFGTPFSLVVNRDISYTELQKLLLKELSGILRSEVFAFATPVHNLFRIRLQDPSCDADTCLEASVEHPLFTEMIDLALSVLPSDAGPPHVKLLLEWQDPERFFTDTSDPFVEHESVCQMKQKIPASSTLTLEQCFEHYTKAETLGQDNAWKCPHCQEYLPVVKTLGLWSLPDIMVIHLKRFRQQQLRSSTQAAKLTNLVKFPLRGFDMTPHLVRDISQQKNLGAHTNIVQGQQQRLVSDTDNWSPWRKIKRSTHSTQSHSTGGTGASGRLQMPMDNRYDLYAVCYHQGDTLETGHYTAACKNPYDGQWYRFDDQRVAHVPNEHIDEEIINNEAYLLFYQRRKLPVATCDGSTGECSGSSSSSSGDHWVSKIVVPQTTSNSAPTTVELTPDRSKKQPALLQSPSTTSLLPPEAALATASIPKTDKIPPETTIDKEFIQTSTVESGPIVGQCTASSDIVPSEACEEKKVIHSSATMQQSRPEVNQLSSENFSKPRNSSMNDTNTLINDETVEPTDCKAIELEQVDTLSLSPSTPLLSLSSSVPTADVNSKAKEKFKCEDDCQKELSQLQHATQTAHSTGSSEAIAQSEKAPLKVSTLAVVTKTTDGDDVFSLRLEKLDRVVEHKLGGTSSLTHSAGRFSLPSSQHYQDIFWRENMSELLHHRPSSFATYKSVIDAGDAVSLIRGTNACSKDTLLFIDQQSHGLDRVVLDDDDVPEDLIPGSGSRALWISPVTPHKLITVSPKN